MALASVVRAEAAPLPAALPLLPAGPGRDRDRDREWGREWERERGLPPAIAAPPHRDLPPLLPGPGIHLLHGTTTLAFKLPHGVVLAVDSRATAGSYVASQSVQKVLEVSARVLGTLAGGAADCAFWQRVLARQCRVYRLRHRQHASVAAAAKLLANMVYHYKGMGLSMGTMIGGWDKRGPGLYYVDSDGTRVPGTAFAVGSGSPYAYGVLDRGYHAELELEAAFALARRAIFHAAHRDAYSGGRVAVYHVGPDGWRRVSCDNVADLQERYGAEWGANQ